MADIVLGLVNTWWINKQSLRFCEADVLVEEMEYKQNVVGKKQG